MAVATGLTIPASGSHFFAIVGNRARPRRSWTPNSTHSPR